MSFFCHRGLFRQLAVFCLLFGGLGRVHAEESSALSWKSPCTDTTLAPRFLTPPELAPTQAAPLVIYLTGLAAPRVGTESDETIVADFLRSGYRVCVLDYAGAARARWPWLNRDIQTLREELFRGVFLPKCPLDKARIYLVPSGHRLLRDVEFYRDGQRILALDVLYPSKPKAPVGTLLEFSCDNQNRYGNYSLQACSDTLLEGAAAEGYAVAMADHPVAAPYKGLDPMPDCAWKTKAAVRTLRSLSSRLDLNGRIVPVGFSRGSGMALLLVSTEGRPEFEGQGSQPEGRSDVQGAVVLSGRFTYLDLLPSDRMIPRYVAAWGSFEEKPEVWRAHGALDYLAGGKAPPLFLSINATEAPEALHQMEVLRARLGAQGVPFEYRPEAEGRGHKVPLDPAVLEPMLRYLRARLTVP